MNKLLSLMILLMPVVALSQNITGAELIANVPVAGRPNFFFKVNDQGNLISFSRALPNDAGGMHPGTNHILDVESGVEYKIPGTYDPVFFPLSQLMIFRSSASKIPYDIFQISELLKGNKEPLSTLPEIIGYYQSTGLLKLQDGLHHYRVIAENHTLAHAVVDFFYDPVTKSIELPKDQSTRLICPNVKLKLPMLSKDGQMIGGLDLTTQTSGVWLIKEDLSCEKILDLGIKSGKLNFNYNGDKLTYHLYRKIEATTVWDDQSHNYVGVPENTFISDIFIYDLKQNAISKITTNHSSNSMYPDFTRDGRVVFINHPHNKEEAPSFVFVQLKENRPLNSY